VSENLSLGKRRKKAPIGKEKGVLHGRQTVPIEKKRGRKNCGSPSVREGAKIQMRINGLKKISCLPAKKNLAKR